MSRKRIAAGAAVTGITVTAGGATAIGTAGGKEHRAPP